MSDQFWAAVQAQLKEAMSAKSAGDLLRIFGKDRNPYGGAMPFSGEAFFAGGDGDELWATLHLAGWTPVWTEATYHWAMRAPDGSGVTYVEGDLYGEIQQPLPHGGEE